MNGLPVKSTIVNGKRRIIITRSASGVSKVKEAILVVMGPGWEFPEDTQKEQRKDA
jgi:hypothetical protein